MELAVQPLCTASSAVGERDTTEELATVAVLDRDPQDIIKRTGIRAGSWVGPEAEVAGLGVAILQAALSKAGLQASGLRKVILCNSTSGDFVVPATSNVLLEKFGVRHTGSAFGNNGEHSGSGFLDHSSHRADTPLIELGRPNMHGFALAGVRFVVVLTLFGVLCQSASAQDSKVNDWTAGWSVAPIAIGILETTVERHVADSVSVQLIGAAGRGTTSVLSTRQVRGLALIDGEWLLQLGAQLRWYPTDWFSRRLFVALEGRGLWLFADQFVTGAALGPAVGAKWTFDSGLTLEACVAEVVAVSSLIQRGTSNRVWAWSYQPTARGTVAWSW